MLESAGFKPVILKCFVEIIFNSLLHAFACFSHAHNTPLHGALLPANETPSQEMDGARRRLLGCGAVGTNAGVPPKDASVPAAIQFTRPVPLYPESRAPLQHHHSGCITYAPQADFGDPMDRRVSCKLLTLAGILLFRRFVVFFFLIKTKKTTKQQAVSIVLWPGRDRKINLFLFKVLLQVTKLIECYCIY